jgi:acyl carrier protein
MIAVRQHKIAAPYSVKGVGGFMRQEEIKEIVLQTLRGIAPEADLESLDPDKRFRDQFEFDSVDFLSFANKLQEKLKIHIPELDFPKLAALRGCIEYLEAKTISRT